ncbi:hypothetical protein ACP70R_027193 [Stipagrostis hirtigluma subsp. patula]
MGACATKSGDLKVKGEPPLVVEDSAAPPATAEEKAKADGVPVAAETDMVDAGRRRSLSDLLREDEETSDGEAADQEAEKVSLQKEAEKAVVEEAATAADDTGATKETEAPVQAPDEAGQDTAEELGDPKDDQERRGGDVHVVEEEKRVDPDSVQVAAAAASVTSAEERKVTDDAST